MNFSFMIPLTTVVVAIYFFKRSSDEMAYLCGAIAVVGLILSLVLAPWQIQLLLLLIVLSTTNLWRSTQIAVESEPEKKPTLLYRGSNYEPTSPTPEVNEVELEGKYRGQVWKTQTPENLPVLKQTFHLKYRGGTVDCQKTVVPIAETALNEEKITDANSTNLEI